MKEEIYSVVYMDDGNDLYCKEFETLELAEEFTDGIEWKAIILKGHKVKDCT